MRMIRRRQCSRKQMMDAAENRVQRCLDVSHVDSLKKYCPKTLVCNAIFVYSCKGPKSPFACSSGAVAGGSGCTVHICMALVGLAVYYTWSACFFHTLCPNLYTPLVAQSGSGRLHGVAGWWGCAPSFSARRRQG